MKGLILKEFLLYKKFKVLYIIIISLFGVLGIFAPGLQFFIALYLSIGILSSLSNDEKNKWTQYSYILPVERKLFVNAKYNVALIISVAVNILNTVMYLISSLFRITDFNIRELLLLYTICFGVSLFPFSFYMPIAYKFNSNVGVVILAIVLLVPLLVIPVGSRVELINKLFSPLPAVSISLIAIAVIIAVFMLSWFISVKIYEKRDL